MRTTKVFSVKNGGMVASDNIVSIIDLELHSVIASTHDFITNKIHLLPQSLIRTPKTDEVIAEEYAEKMDEEVGGNWVGHYDDFLAGRKSFGDKKYHLSEEELDDMIIKLINTPIFPSGTLMSEIKDYLLPLTPPIYPHTITVEHDGYNYLWETLKAEY